MNPRHLQPRRPRKDRDVTWSRKYSAERYEITWACFRRDHRGALHMRSRAFAESEIFNAPSCWVPVAIRFLHRELRDFVDEIDLAAMEETTCSAG